MWGGVDEGGLRHMIIVLGHPVTQGIPVPAAVTIVTSQKLNVVFQSTKYQSGGSGHVLSKRDSQISQIHNNGNSPRAQ